MCVEDEDTSLYLLAVIGPLCFLTTGLRSCIGNVESTERGGGVKGESGCISGSLVNVNNAI